MIIDPTTNLGKLRLRVSDWSELPYLPDSVYLQTLADNNDNIQKSTVVIGNYLLGIFSQGTHRRLSQNLEVWGGERFSQYLKYLMLIVKDPSFSGISPIPYSASGTELHPILQHISDWKKNYPLGTEAQALAVSAAISPNTGDLYGPTVIGLPPETL